jgi:hypothetical protein
MNHSFVVLLSILLLASTGRANDFSGKSPDGKLTFESRNEKELYLWATDQPGKKTLVYKDEVVFVQAAAISPDDQWIAVEQGGASLGHTILFFRRQQGLTFQQVGGKDNDPDPVDKIATFALLTKGIKENIMDHVYLHPLTWGEKSKWLTVALDAKGSYQGKRAQITNWRCRYNPVSHEVQAIKGNPGKIEIGLKSE